jgi:hypothetical protein
MDFKTGDILRAYNKNSVVATNIYSAYNITNGLIANQLFNQTDLVKTIPTGNVFGIVQEVDTVNNVALVWLSIQVYSYGKQISHGYVKLDTCEKINAIVTAGKPYYATVDNLNIRDKSGVLGTIRTKAMKGDLLGRSDGVKDANGFARFQLALGGIGFISAKNISLTKPARTIKVIHNPDQSITEVSNVGYSPNEKIKFGLIGLAGLGLAYYGIKKLKK